MVITTLHKSIHSSCDAHADADSDDGTEDERAMLDWLYGTLLSLEQRYHLRNGPKEPRDATQPACGRSVAA